VYEAAKLPTACEYVGAAAKFVHWDMISVVVTCSVTVLVGEKVSVVVMTSVTTSVTLLIIVSVCNGPRIEVDVVVVDVTVVETTVVTGAEVIKQEQAVLMKLLA
jgi:hypothetical protein